MTLLKKIANTLLFLTLTSHLPLCALIEESIDTKSILEVTLSTTSPNRIMFEDGAIIDVVLDDNKFQSFLHQKTGQLFLTPLRETDEHSTSVTLLTSCGEAQTLSVLAQPGPGEIIILKDSKNTSSNLEDLSYDFHSSAVDFLNDLLSGNVPYGYGVRAPEDEKFPIGSPFKTKLVRLLEGPFEEVFVIEVHNSSRRGESLSPTMLKRPNDLWVFLSKNHLEPGEKTLAIISKKKELS